MFLDSNNCFHLDGIGLYVFYPEINEIYFYQEKTADKIFTFEPLKINVSLNKNTNTNTIQTWLKFQECKVLDFRSKQKKINNNKIAETFRKRTNTLNTLKSILLKTSNLSFYSIYNNNDFANYYNNNRPTNKIYSENIQNSRLYIINEIFREANW